MHAATWWIDRWRKSTAYTEMTLAEQGAYRNLLDELWLRESPLPDDDRTLGRISGDPVEWPRVRDRVMAHFLKTPEGWVNETQAEVIASSIARQNAITEKARKAAAVRWGWKTGVVHMHGHMLDDAKKATSAMPEQCHPVSGIQEKRRALQGPPVCPEPPEKALNEIPLEEYNEISLEVLHLWNTAVEWLRGKNPDGRRWTRHWSMPARAADAMRVLVGRLGREMFLAQLKDFLRWAVRDEFWSSLRHDGDRSDRWVPTLVSALDLDKWDMRVEIAIASVENRKTLDRVAQSEEEREAASNAELQRILAVEREKIRRRDEMAGGDSNAMFAVEDPTANNDPEIISVVEAAEELIQKRHRRNGASS